MGNAILVIGQSGSGKSTALRNLDPKTTFIINVLDKPLPFKGYKKHYKKISKDNPEGNYYASDNWANIVKCIQSVNKYRPDIKTLVIDDWQYILSYEFMRRTGERGFDKYSEMGMHGWSTINECMNVRDGLNVYLLSHSELDNAGKYKPKTIGKLLDEKITIEGLFTIVLHARVIDGEHWFQTKYNGEHICKSPMGMFEEEFIPNDLLEVNQSINAYYNEGEDE